MKVSIRYLNRFKETVTHTYYLIKNVQYDPVFVYLTSENETLLKVRSVHLLQLDIEDDPETLIF